MHHKYRALYNELLTPEKYDQLNKEIANRCGANPSFRIGETPVFIPEDLWDNVISASRQLLEFVTASNFKTISEGSMVPGTKVPNETAHPHMITFDFGICTNKDGSLGPKLIEMQGFPTVTAFQYQLFKSYQAIAPEIEKLSPFIDVTEQEYLDHLQSIIGKPNSVLLDVTPEKQNTYIDFRASELLFGIPSVCVSDLRKDGNKLYYTRDGQKHPIDYLYNRVIFDELLQREDLDLKFSFFEDLDVKWISHPNWYFRISKYVMPYMDFDFVPKSYFVSELEEIPSNLEDYVLKPLFSFSGQGVKMNVTPEDIAAVTKENECLLQEKVSYAPVIEAPDGKVKFEIRMIALWPDELEKPVLAFNVIRMTKGAMIGVKYNKDKAWVGSSVGLKIPNA